MNTTLGFKAVLTSALVLSAACGAGSTSPGSGDAAGAPANGASGGASTPGGGATSSAGSAGTSVVGPGGNSAGGSSAGTASAAGGQTALGGGAGTSVGGGLGTGGSSGGTGGGSSGGTGGGTGSTTVAFSSGRVSVTGVRGTTSPAAASVIALHNGGASAAQITALTLSGANAALFRVTSPTAFPVSLAAGADLPVTVEMMTTGAALPAAPANKDMGSVLLTGTLTANLSSGSASASLYGFVLTLVNYEATLGQVLTALGYGLNVGKAQNNWNPNTSMNAANLPGIETGTDEVAASHFVKAGAGMVTIKLVARFSPPGALPFGYYTTTTGCPTGCMNVGTMAQVTDAQTSDKARMVNPPPGTGMASFDPGTAPFGLWVYSDQKTQKFNPMTASSVNGDYDYTQDALNLPAPGVHRFKSYPLKDAAGAAIPQTYLVAVEEAGNGDYQDYVFVLSNVTAMP